MKRKMIATFTFFVLVCGIVPGMLRAAKEISADEATAWSSASGEKDPAKQSALLESYLQAYPEGNYVKQCHYLLAIASMQTKQPEKLILHGEEALKADPDNTDMLLILADQYSKARESATWEKAVAYADKCVQILDKKAASDPPAGVATDQWKTQIDGQKKAALYTRGYAKGKVAIQAKDWAAAEAGLRSAFEVRKDAFVAFLLGSVYVNLQKPDEAITALCEAVALGGPKQADAQKKLEAVYQQKNGSLEGLQAKIDEAKAKIGQH